MVLLKASSAFVLKSCCTREDIGTGTAYTNVVQILQEKRSKGAVENLLAYSF